MLPTSDLDVPLAGSTSTFQKSQEQRIHSNEIIPESPSLQDRISLPLIDSESEEESELEDGEIVETQKQPMIEEVITSDESSQEMALVVYQPPPIPVIEELSSEDEPEIQNVEEMDTKIDTNEAPISQNPMSRPPVPMNLLSGIELDDD